MKTCICVSTQSDNQGPFEEYPVIDGPLVRLPDWDTWWLYKSDECSGYYFAKTFTGELVFVLED